LNGGSAIFCDLPGRRADILIDCGNTNSVEFTTQPFLRAHGVNKLPALLISHGDVPHAAGADLIAQAFAAKRVIIPPLHFQSSPYNKVLQALNNRPEKTETFGLGDRLGLWTVLHPDRTDSFRRGADKALVLTGDIFGTRVLLLSDLGRDGQEKLLERQAELRADILVTGIPPGRDEPVCEGLLDSARPQLIIVLDSEFPATARAKDPLRDRLSQRKVPVIYTREAAAVTLTFRPQTWRAQTMTGVTIEGRPSPR
jgi:beta-lactamase superfamily II metal-dependent hydrolase